MTRYALPISPPGPEDPDYIPEIDDCTCSNPSECDCSIASSDTLREQAYEYEQRRAKYLPHAAENDAPDSRKYRGTSLSRSHRPSLRIAGGSFTFHVGRNRAAHARDDSILWTFVLCIFTLVGYLLGVSTSARTPRPTPTLPEYAIPEHFSWTLQAPEEILDLASFRTHGCRGVSRQVEAEALGDWFEAKVGPWKEGGALCGTPGGVGEEVCEAARRRLEGAYRVVKERYVGGYEAERGSVGAVTLTEVFEDKGRERGSDVLPTVEMVETSTSTVTVTVQGPAGVHGVVPEKATMKTSVEEDVVVKGEQYCAVPPKYKPFATFVGVL